MEGFSERELGKLTVTSRCPCADKATELEDVCSQLHRHASSPNEGNLSRIQAFGYDTSFLPLTPIPYTIKTRVPTKNSRKQHPAKSLVIRRGDSTTGTREVVNARVQIGPEDPDLDKHSRKQPRPASNEAVRELSPTA